MSFVKEKGEISDESVRVVCVCLADSVHDVSTPSGEATPPQAAERKSCVLVQLRPEEKKTGYRLSDGQRSRRPRGAERR